ncbi:MAG: ABC transporter substrate-binding protein [Xanthobacteraceae bacterium]|jgi:putative tryptophan/tyrosine transport system substrate-binding protein
MRRREFITLFSSAVVAWPLTALAQKPAAKIWRLGILQPGAPPDPLVDTLQERLKELGYSEGHNIAYEYGWAEGKPPRLTELAKELVDLKVDVITAFSTPAAIAAQKATQTIPIVFGGVGDPVGSGVVSSLSRPGGNITGISILATELSAKRLELLEEIVPGASPVAMFWNDSNPGMVLRAHEAQNAAGKLGLNLQSIGVHDLISFDTAFAAIESGRFNALLILVDPFTREHRQRIVDFAAQRRLPAIYESREFVDAGGLISYGPSLTALERRVADYVSMVFKGSNPADLPVELPTKFEMVIGMKAAKALGLTLSQSVVMRADELIE